MRWLAAYPRSGTSYIRTLIGQCFGQQTASLYAETLLPWHMRQIMRAVSLPMFERDLEALRERQPVLTVKSHQWPMNRGCIPHLLIVRDPRCVLPSLQTFGAEMMKGNTDWSFQSCLHGDNEFGDWGTWHKLWIMAQDEQTVILRYCDIIHRPADAIKALAMMLDSEPTQWTVPSFEELNARTPEIWRRGKTSTTLTTSECDQVWERFRPIMEMFGYSRDVEKETV